MIPCMMCGGPCAEDSLCPGCDALLSDLWPPTALWRWRAVTGVARVIRRARERGVSLPMPYLGSVVGTLAHLADTEDALVARRRARRTVPSPPWQDPDAPWWGEPGYPEPDKNGKPPRGVWVIPGEDPDV